MFQNQIYVPPKDQSTCCGVCKNISCLYEHENGTTVLYKVGSNSVILNYNKNKNTYIYGLYTCV